MKKLALTTVCALGMAGAAFAQGSVNWNSFSPAAVTFQTNSTAYSPLFGGGPTGSGAVGVTGTAANGFYYQLLYTTYSGSQATIATIGDLLSWSDAGLSAVNGTIAPLAGNINGVNPTTQATVPWAAGTTDSIVLVGWSANLGTTWGAVSTLLGSTTSFADGSFLGVTQTGYIAPNAANPGVTVFTTSAQTYGLPINGLGTQLYLLPSTSIPEPATMALAGLGGLSLLLFRRRQQK